MGLLVESGVEVDVPDEGAVEDEPGIDEGELPEPLMPVPVVLEPLEPEVPVESVLLGVEVVVLLLVPVFVPMLPGSLLVELPLWLPVVLSVLLGVALVPVPMLPAAPVPEPLPPVWASAKVVASESVAIKRNFRISFSLFSLLLLVGRLSRPFKISSGVFHQMSPLRQMLGEIPQPPSISRAPRACAQPVSAGFGNLILFVL